MVMILNRKYSAHRLSWLYSTGEWPFDEVDHIDGNGTNNKLINLRSVSRLENNKNKRLRTDNKSGRIGVSWHKSKRCWSSKITVERKQIHLGDFNSYSKAVKAREAAEIKYGFHKNHGSDRPL